MAFALEKDLWKQISEGLQSVCYCDVEGGDSWQTQQKVGTPARNRCGIVQPNTVFCLSYNHMYTDVKSTLY